MLDKLKLNNHITALKNDVQKAKTQVIQKLVRRIKEMQTDSKKRTNQNLTKNELKIQKLKDEISVLKKLNFRTIVKDALLLQKEPKAVLSDSKAKTEDRCVARMYEHKVLFKKLEMLKDVFGLKEQENIKGLRSMGLSKTQKVKMKKRAKLKELNKKEKKPEKMEWIEEDNNETNGAQSEIVDEQPEKSVVHEENQEKRKKSVSKTPKAPSSSSSNSKKLPKLNKVEFSSESEDEGNDVEKTTDSFFLTTSGENYQAAVVKNTSEDDFQLKLVFKENDDFEVEERFDRYHDEREENFNENSDRRTNFNQNIDRRNDFNRNFDQRNNFNQNFDRRHNSRFDSRQKPFERNNSFQSKIPRVEEDLHPSWKAKQQQQRTIQQFQGKKIKFGDDSNTKEADESKELHPSWAAKLKTKPVITEFAGKKIRFDDD